MVAALASALVLGTVAGASAQRLSDDEYQAALQRLRSNDPTERVAAAELLGRRGYSKRREIAPRLRDLLRNDPDWRVRASSGRAIGRLGTRSAVPDLVAALRDPQVEVRVVAAAALWRLPDPAAVPALLETLEDSDAAARQWAALALGVVRDTRATAPLVELLADPSGDVRTDVIRSLGRIADISALPALRDYVNDDDRDMDERLEAVNAIASLNGPEKVNALVRLLNHDEERIRLRVVSALGQVGDALVIPSLRRRKAQEDEREVRAAIDEAVEEIRTRMRERRNNR